MQRRQFLANSASISAAGALWSLLRSPVEAAPHAHPAVDPLLDCVCDLVIPDSETPGAKASGVPPFIHMAFAHGLAGSSPDDRALLEALLHDASPDFLSLPRRQQHDLLAAVDLAAYATPGSVWPRIKNLILMGYYTSEVGASQELIYQLVPGRYDPDLPQNPGDRASSTDWTGQRF